MSLPVVYTDSVVWLCCVFQFLLSHLKNLEGIIRDSKVNPSLHPSYYASVTGQLMGNEGSKTTPINAEQAAAAAAGTHDDNESAEGGTDEEADDGDKAKAKRRKTARKGAAKGAASAAHASASSSALGVGLLSDSPAAASASSSSAASKAAAAAAAASLPDDLPLFHSGVAVSGYAAADDSLLSAFPLSSQFPSSQLSAMADDAAHAESGGGGGGGGHLSSLPRKSHLAPPPVIAATITPSSLTIAPTAAQPTTVTIQTYMDAIMQHTQHSMQQQQQQQQQ